MQFIDVAVLISFVSMAIAFITVLTLGYMVRLVYKQRPLLNSNRVSSALVDLESTICVQPQPQTIPMMETLAQMEIELADSFFKCCNEYEDEWRLNYAPQTTEEFEDFLPFRLPHRGASKGFDSPKNFLNFSVVQNSQEATISMASLLLGMLTHRMVVKNDEESTIALEEELQYGELDKWDQDNFTSLEHLKRSLSSNRSRKYNFNIFNVLGSAEVEAPQSAQTIELIDFKPKKFLVKRSQIAA